MTAELTARLLGKWERATDSPCAQRYPLQLTFQPNGLYFTGPRVEGVFTIWDVGTYQVVSLTEIRISTANDAIVTYRFSSTETSISFEDPDRCRFEYRRQ